MRKLATLFFLALLAAPASAVEDKRVDVLEISGLIDAPTQRAVLRGLEKADGAEAVVLQIDSSGGYDLDRLQVIARAIESSAVPVITWVGPPGARAAHGAAYLAGRGHLRAMAPGSSLGPMRYGDLRHPDDQPIVPADPAVLSAAQAADDGRIDVVALQLPDLLDKANGRAVTVGGRQVTLATDPAQVQARFRKLDLLGRAQHGMAKPSIAYLVLLTGLVGIVFEAFHPSRGPAGWCGLAGVCLAMYGFVSLHGSWLGLALLVGGILCFCVDLRFQSVGVFTLAGLAGLIAGSLLLFGSPMLRVSPWMLVFGVAAMVSFLMAAMTRVLADLRALASGELEVSDPHPS